METVHLTVFKNTRRASAVVHTGFLIDVEQGPYQQFFRADFGADPNAPENQSSLSLFSSLSSSSLSSSSSTSTTSLPSGISGRVVELIENYEAFLDTVEEYVHIGEVYLSSQELFDLLQNVADHDKYDVAVNNCRDFCIKTVNILANGGCCKIESAKRAVGFLQGIKTNDALVVGAGLLLAGAIAWSLSTSDKPKKKDSH